MHDVVEKQLELIEQLEKELQNQKGMLWLLGEIMKIATNIDSFNVLMDLVTDMLMGVTGVNTCYIWIKDKDKYHVYLRSTNSCNRFVQEIPDDIPEALKDVDETLILENEQITFSLIEGEFVPKSRLVVPLFNFTDSTLIGGMVLEQNQQGFFTKHNTIFFETLATFIACNTRNSRMYEQIAEQSERDPLTGVYNRRYLVKLLNRYMEKNEEITIAVIDTDNFKKVNDKLGHLVGDEVLKSIAVGATKLFKPHKGKVIRYGGDEFVIVIPKGLNESLVLFETLQKAVPKLPVVDEIEIPVTITMGVCSYPEMTIDKERILQTADNALLRGKDCGKNRIILASERDS